MAKTFHPVFDKAERAKIRRKLRAYMDRYKVGTPDLSVRIADQIGRERRQVSYKTLQHFLADSHWTQHEFVGYCLKFLTAVTPPHPDEGLADSLARFMFSAADFDTSEAHQAIFERYKGWYHAAIRPRPFKLPGLSLILNPAPGCPYLKATALFGSISADGGSTGAEETGRSFPYTGLFLPGADRCLLLLRNAVLESGWLFVLSSDPQTGHRHFEGYGANLTRPLRPHWGKPDFTISIKDAAAVIATSLEHHDIPGGERLYAPPKPGKARTP